MPFTRRRTTDRTYATRLGCGTVLTYEAPTFLPGIGETVPCRRHGFCPVVARDPLGRATRGAVSRAVGGRSQEELMTFLSRRPVTTVHVLRYSRSRCGSCPPPSGRASSTLTLSRAASSSAPMAARGRRSGPVSPWPPVPGERTCLGEVANGGLRPAGPLRCPSPDGIPSTRPPNWCSPTHAGLEGAISAVLFGAPWRWCREHLMRNVLARVPKGNSELVATTIRTVFGQPAAEHVQSRLHHIAGLLGTGSPKVEPMPATPETTCRPAPASPPRPREEHGRDGARAVARRSSPTGGRRVVRRTMAALRRAR
jgi:hypothetical protein